MPLDADALPDFPWDSLTPYRQRATAHPEGIIDLSVGTPVDPTPEVITRALAEGSQWPGYPLTVGTPALQDAMVRWWQRRRGVAGLGSENVLPSVGSKEVVALLAAMLGLGQGDAVLHPRAAYPTYDIGARLTGATPVAVDPAAPATWAEAVARAGRAQGRDLRLALVWLNSPGNPDGSVLSVAQLREAVQTAREHGALVVNDECYAELPFEIDAVPSILDARVLSEDGDGAGAQGLSGVLALYSLSKQSNMAGYRAAMMAGDEAVIARVREIRKHCGMMLPGPIQEAMTIALGDDAHVAQQRELYARRREQLVAVLAAAGLTREQSGVAGLYLWVTLQESVAQEMAQAGRAWDCWDLVGALADRGILVAPGAFYGDAGRRHVRLGLTGSDQALDTAAARLAQGPLLRPQS